MSANLEDEDHQRRPRSRNNSPRTKCCARSRARVVARIVGLILALGWATGLRAAPAVTCENFNELGSAYQQAPNNTALSGLPGGITANFNWHWQLMWSPGVNPPNSAATNNVEVGWTPASPAVTFSQPVVLWSVAIFKKWNNTLSLVGRRNGNAVWAYTNSDGADHTWVLVNKGAGKIIDELDVNCDAWGVKFTDFRLSDATDFSAYTNSTPYYVEGANPMASDYNPGTEGQPWKTIQWAASALQAGDTVYIKAGTYTGDVRPACSGMSNAWITYSAYPGHELRAVIDHAGIFISQRSFIKILGMKIQYASGVGIRVVGPGANYIISGNYTYDTGSSGIAVWGVPWQSDPGLYDYRAITHVLIHNNTIEKACDGGWDEQLDIANGVDSFEVSSNILKNGINAINGGEGIDCKEGASNGKIWGNQIFNIRRYAIYLDAGASDPAYYKIRPGLLTNIEVFNNLVHNNDAHGIGITSEGRGNIDGIKIYNNICYSNGCDGILLYHYPNTTNYARNITVINNTTYNNNTSPTTPYYGGIATDHDTAQNVVVRNNIASEALGFAIKAPWNPATIMDHNLTSDPRFVGAATGDFHLQSNSPAIDSGAAAGAPAFDFDGSSRPCGSAYDAGAFEYHAPAPLKLRIQQVPGQPTPLLLLEGGPESHYRLEWQSDARAANWFLLQDIPSLPCSPYAFCDSTADATVSQRFYRALLLR